MSFITDNLFQALLHINNGRLEFIMCDANTYKFTIQIWSEQLPYNVVQLYD